MHRPDRIRVKFTATGPGTDLSHRTWELADEIVANRYWSGAEAEIGRHFSARLLWSDEGLHVRFAANCGEPVVLGERPDLAQKTMNLWDRDVCEIFVAPDRADPNRYFEFEVAPTGEWIDLAIRITPAGRETDWEYSSGMSSAAAVKDNSFEAAIAIPWSAFGKKPLPDEIWLGNLFRCVGRDPGRGYLAWRPTETEVPAFHVPEKFGEFVFVR